MPEIADFPDVTKHVTVPAPATEAFRVLIEQVADWLPPNHTVIRQPELIRIEPGVGGRFFERGPDGTEVVHGVITEWDPPRRVKMTWRMGADWRPTPDDATASLTEFAFEEQAPQQTCVELTHSELHRHGEAAAMIRAALDGPSPGETLARYAEVVGRGAGVLRSELEH